MEKKFIGRKDELNSLKLLRKKKSASLVVIRGRRRIGKSQLAEEFGKTGRFLRFSGLPPTPETTADSQRQEFAKQLAINLNTPELQATDWTPLLHFLARETRSGPIIILFDEISWLGGEDPLFLGKLKNAWEQLRQNPQLILILCGSVSLWIEENILSNTGFMGRLSLDLVLEELSLAECQQLLKAHGVHSNAYETFKLLSVTGGVPRYLEEVQPGLSADENIRRLAFSKSGILFREFNDIFHDLFSKRSQFYQKITTLLAAGPLELQEICDALKVQKSGVWSAYLEELCQAGFVKRDFTWHPKTQLTGRLSHYRLSDNYLRFYLKHIEPNRTAIQSGLFRNRALSSLPAWDSVMGLQFENLVLNNTPLIWQALNLNANDILAHGPYFQRKTQRHAGCQIDYLIQTRHNTLIACEIKFSRHPITPTIIPALTTKHQALTLPKGSALWPVLIHVNGVSEEVVDSQYFTHTVNFADYLTEG